MDVAMQIYSAKRLLVLRDYKTSLEKCEEGLEALQNEEEVERISVLDEEDGVEKARIAFGVLALQGLTLDGRENEMDAFAGKWFGCSRNFPSEILQICACHHLQMQESQLALDLLEEWLSEERNHNSSGLNKVAELYVRHILLPLKEIEKAETFLEEFKAISSENKKELIMYISKKKEELSQPVTDEYEINTDVSDQSSCSSSSDEVAATKKVLSKGPILGLFLKVFKFFKTIKQMVINNASMKTGLLSCARLVVLAFFLYIIFLRTYLPGDVFNGRGSGSVLLWNAVKQVWSALFAPYHMIQAA
ncbi:uncharacterized protein LOC116305873 [Actinia tenebrosa]|uniref:Uncharacterized protein LOC116305873 n=1 Tax=Actinia tenebrosa TaxID=6105 RepID=A0A6P8IX88_ACTTE|nr:uncharacterized protein LOC116305873 [Actinia tenebrosa]